MALVQANAPSSNFFLDGNFSPVHEERDAEDMEVIGAIPTDLQGHFLRVGPNPVHVFSEEDIADRSPRGYCKEMEYQGHLLLQHGQTRTCSQIHGICYVQRVVRGQHLLGSIL